MGAAREIETDHTGEDGCSRRELANRIGVGRKSQPLA